MHSSRTTPARRAPTPSSPPPAIAKGATARSAASPRVTSSLSNPARRPSQKVNSLPVHNGDSRDASLKQETDQKEHLLVQLQDKEQTIAALTTENDNLTSALNAAESRLNELYAEQSRSEVELAQRIDIIDKLRAQVRELEREKRELQRRYNEQTASFEAERQAFYDNEQHLKFRIQSLTQARKQAEPDPIQVSENDAEINANAQPPQLSTDGGDMDIKPTNSTPKLATKQDFNDPESEPAEMTALKLELSTLSTSYASLQSTLVLLQTQLVDLKRVNRELQEENESYMILLREKTLSGQFDVMRQVGGGVSESEDDDDEHDSIDARSLLSSARSTLDKVDELPESLEHELGLELEQSQDSHDRNTPSTWSTGRHSRNRSASIRGESLADLPITGPGLDLAAELGRAENKDILSNLDDRDRLGHPGKKRSKKGSDGRKTSADVDSTKHIDALRTEVKSLKDANKALSLYASKIIDRIIAQEGFEHVLAADYEADPKTPLTTTQPTSNPAITVSDTSPKGRPQSVLVGRSTSGPAGPMPENPSSSHARSKAQRRSLSFDWKGFSFFSGGSEKKPDSHLRPLTLTPGSAPITGARKLETFEDEEDRKERERLNATMKLMGIQPPTPPPATLERTQSTPQVNINRRFSLFGRSASTTSDTAPGSTPAGDSARVGLGIEVSSDLTQEALVHAEAQNSIAALDAQERSLSVELARGSGSGFTEIAPRGLGRKSRRSGGDSGSGSTVWSAGMSANDE